MMTSALNPEHQQLVYMLFAREVGPLVKNKYPNIEKMQFNQILGRIWSELPQVEKNKYILKADFQRKMEMGGSAPAPMAPVIPGVGLRQSPSPPMLGRPNTAPVPPVMRPFERYAAQTKMTLMKQYPYLGAREMDQLVLRMWSQLSEAEKARYNDMSVMRTLQQQQQFPGQPQQMIVMRRGPSPPQQHLQMPPAASQLITPPPSGPIPLEELNKVKLNVTEKTENNFMREDDSEEEDDDEEEAGTLSEGSHIKKIPFAALTSDSQNREELNTEKDKVENSVKNLGADLNDESKEEKDRFKDSTTESENDDEEEGKDKIKSEDSQSPQLSSLKIIPAALESKITEAKKDDDNPDDPEGVEMPDEDDVPSEDESDEDSEASEDDEDDVGEKLTDPLDESSSPLSDEDRETKSFKNKVPPVAHLSPPAKSIKVEEALGKTVAVSNPEKSTQKCNTCKVLVDEVKKRGEMIEKLRKRIQLMEAEMGTKLPSLDKDGLDVAG